MDGNSRSLTIARIAPIEILTLIASFAIVTWAIVGEYRGGIYGGTYFLPLYIIPILQLLRLQNLDLDTMREKKWNSAGAMDKILPIFAIIFTFAAIPYYFANCDILPQNVIIINVIFTGYLDHVGIHHGMLGWYFILEAYFYQRLNRYAVKDQESGKYWRNFLLVFGLYMFFNDYWEEQFTNGALHMFDPFVYIENKMPYSWDKDFMIELVVVFAIFMICEMLYFYFHKKHTKKALFNLIPNNMNLEQTKIELNKSENLEQVALKRDTND